MHRGEFQPGRLIICKNDGQSQVLREESKYIGNMNLKAQRFGLILGIHLKSSSVMKRKLLKFDTF